MFIVESGISQRTVGEERFGTITGGGLSIVEDVVRSTGDAGISRGLERLAVTLSLFMRQLGCRPGSDGTALTVM